MVAGIMQIEVSSPDELVKALGGPTRAAEILGEAAPGNVSNWVRRGKLPAQRFLQHQAILAERGIKAPSSLWLDFSQYRDDRDHKKRGASP